ncbi:DUF2000 domain-containing protein [Actinomycetes bacterium KLBMP 9759]
MVARCVLVLDPDAPRWLIANTAAVLGASVGVRGLVPLGPDLTDADGARWAGTAEVVVPVLAGTPDQLGTLHAEAVAAGVTAVAFPDTAQRSPTYADFAAAMSATPTADVRIHGLALIGSGNAVRRLTRTFAPLGEPVPAPLP